MGTTLEEMAESAECRALALRLILKNYPDATPEVLWDDGPAVPCIFDRKGTVITTGVHVVIANKSPAFIRYLTIPIGDNEDDAARVYVVSNRFHGAVPWYFVFDELSPEGMREFNKAMKGGAS